MGKSSGRARIVGSLVKSYISDSYETGGGGGNWALVWRRVKSRAGWAVTEIIRFSEERRVPALQAMSLTGFNRSHISPSSHKFPGWCISLISSQLCDARQVAISGSPLRGGGLGEGAAVLPATRRPEGSVIAKGVHEPQFQTETPPLPEGKRV